MQGESIGEYCGGVLAIYMSDTLWMLGVLRKLFEGGVVLSSRIENAKMAQVLAFRKTRTAVKEIR